MSWPLVIAVIVVILVIRWLFKSSRTSARPRAEPSLEKPAFSPNRTKADYQPIRPVMIKAAWIPPGNSVSVQGHSIDGGMLYVADNADDSSPACLIGRMLPVASTADVSGSDMDYWPRYSAITPSSRAAYLRWLSSGRLKPDCYIGYVFLYFYGLERRLLVDNAIGSERDAILSELRRLLGIYGQNNSFRRYCTALIGYAEALQLINSPEGTHFVADPLAQPEMALPLKIAIARKVVKGEGLNFDLALAGYLGVYQYSGWTLKVGATRSPKEFTELCRMRFERTFPTGFLLKNKKSSKLRISYGPAANDQDLRSLSLPETGLPDPIELTWTKMAEVVESAMDDLAPYARFLGRNPDRAGTPEAVSQLPAELQPSVVKTAFENQAVWLASLGGPTATVRLGELATKLTGEESVDQRSQRSLAEMLELLGYGIEPDPVFGGIRAKAEDTVCVFKNESGDKVRAAPRPAYTLAMAIATLVAGVAASSVDGLGAEELKWLGWITDRLNLTKPEAVRLQAHVQWLALKRPTLTQVKKLIANVPVAERMEIADFAAAVAAADGIIENAETAFLEKIYDELGVERQRLYSALHNHSASRAAPAGEPVTVAQAEPAIRHSVTPQRQSKKRGKGASEIDPAKLQQVVAETRRVSEMLSTIFVENEEEHAETPQAATSSAFAGLSQQCAKLAAVLITREQWVRAEFDAEAKGLGLMPGGALEEINEWAFDKLGEALLEDGDPLVVNRTILLETT